ncbi:MAG: hypothetical protein ABF968_04795 [Acetobacter sp.]|uniref:hypothetical protein n=1 Tax=Acetobacter sp. TaxID=440 RepID=UPI0039EB34A3
MKRILAFCCFFALVGCSDDGISKQKLTEMNESMGNCDMKFPSEIGNYANNTRCKGEVAIRTTEAIKQDPSSIIQLTNALVNLWSRVDRGEISVQAANQEISMYSAQMHAQSEYAKQQRAEKSRAAWGDALMGMSAGMAAFNNGYSHPSYVAPVYRSPTTCMTQPSGGGFVTSCNH